MPLPMQNVAELARWVKHIVGRWQLGHDPSSAIAQGICLGMTITREDYFRVVKAYCDNATENRTYGKKNDQQQKH